MSKIIDKKRLLECLRDEANAYEGSKDAYGKAVYGLNKALIQEIESGRFDSRTKEETE